MVGMRFIPSASRAAAAPSAGTTRWHCVPSLHSSSSLSLTLLQVKYFIRRMSSEQRFYFPSKKPNGEDFFFFLINMEAVEEAGRNFRV